MVVPICLWGLGNQHRRGLCTLFFRIPIDRGMTIPQIASFDHDTYHHIVKHYTCLLLFLAHLVFGDVQSRWSKKAKPNRRKAERVFDISLELSLLKFVQAVGIM